MNRSSIAPPRGPKVRRDLLLLGGLLAFVIAGLVGLALATGWQETMAQVSKLGWVQVLALLALSLANYVLRGFRWHLFTRRLGLHTQLIQNMRHFLGGFAMSVTPGRLSELIRMRWLGRETGARFEKTAPLVLVDRASDLSAMALILAVAVSFSATGITGALPVAILALIGAFLSTRAVVVQMIASYLYRIIGRWPRFFARIRSAARALARFSGPDIVLIAALIGAAGWLAEGYAFYLLLSWLGAETALSTAIAIFMFATLAGGLTGAPGGLGGAEAAMVAFLTLQGVPIEISLPATAIIRLTTLWFAIAIGLVVFPIAERLSKQGQDALEAG